MGPSNVVLETSDPEVTDSNFGISQPPKDSSIRSYDPSLWTEGALWNLAALIVSCNVFLQAIDFWFNRRWKSYID